ncbi:sulfotransferase family protein [Bacteroidota bacterium]
MIWIIAVLSGLIFSFVLISTRGTFYSLARNSVSLLNIILSDIDDDDKMSFLIKNLKKTIVSTILFLLVIILLVFIAIFPSIVFSYFINNTLEIQILEFPEILLFGAGTVIPFLFQRKSNSDYSEISKLFHELVLDNYYLGKRLFKFQIKKINSIAEEFVIVSGLARSGTTALTLALSTKGPFRSLNYANMPFLLSPKLWAVLYKPKSKTLKERKHGDKIKIGLDSVEALEEYFFKVFLKDSFIKENTLVQHQVDETIYSQYLKYQKSIAGDKIYLAKNNNLILRFESLRKQNNKFHAIFMFRDPVSHARSLLAQHTKFLDFQAKDKFILKYMNWLGHHEFGEGHKIFTFEEQQNFGDPKSINYWIRIWINYYKNLLSINQKYFLLEYHDFLKYPEEFIHALSNLTDIELSTDGINKFTKEMETRCEDCDPLILKEANNIYSELQKKKEKLKSGI